MRTKGNGMDDFVPTVSKGFDDCERFMEKYRETSLTSQVIIIGNVQFNFKTARNYFNMGEDEKALEQLRYAERLMGSLFEELEKDEFVIAIKECIEKAIHILID